MSVKTQNLAKELKLAQEAALQAGKAIAKFYGKHIEVKHKSPNQPVTAADLAANDIIKTMLSQNFPRDGWLSEEDIDDPTRITKERIWIVDPLDGTKDFIGKNPQFAVSIALVENKVPVLGVVYNPITKELFSATLNHGAFLNGKPIQVAKKNNPQDKTHLLVSISESKRGEWQEYENQFKMTPTGGCAYKMGQIAQGKAHGSFTLTPKSEWDVCGGTVIISEAGGIVSYLDGSELKFNQASTIMDGLIFCCDQEVHAEILSTTREQDSFCLTSNF